MSYPAYPEYKDSGTTLLGLVPKNWVVHKLGYCIETIVPMRDKPKDLIGPIPWIRIEDFDGKYIGGSSSGQGVTEETVRQMNLKIFPVGTVLCTCSCSMGTTAIVSNPIISNQTFIGLRPLNRLHSEYLFYLMQSAKDELTAQSNGAIQTYLSKDEFKALRFAFPSLQEQKKIADFLDHEITKIDKLINKSERLISLLLEKRKALISHAVTKGLDPNVPTKDSGIEWIGRISEHWNMSRLKFECEIKGRIGFRGYTVEDLVPEGEGALVIGATEMTSEGKIHLVSPQFILWEKYFESPEIMLDKNYVLIVQRGSTVGKVALIDKDLGQATVNPSVIVIKTKSLHPNYLLYWLMSDPIQQIIRSQTSSTAIPMISQEQVGNYCLSIPPLDEQKKIAAFLAEKVGELSLLIDKTQQQTDKLEEHRSTLISAAVTGKIDVRKWNKKEKAA